MGILTRGVNGKKTAAGWSAISAIDSVRLKFCAWERSMTIPRTKFWRGKLVPKRFEVIELRALLSTHGASGRALSTRRFGRPDLGSATRFARPIGRSWDRKLHR